MEGMAGDTGAPGFIPLYDDDTQFAPIQSPFNGVSTAVNNALKITSFSSYPDLATLNLPANVGTQAGQHATVYADPTAGKNGDYIWSGTAWVYYRPRALSGSVKRSATAATFSSGAWTPLTNTNYWQADQPASGLNNFAGTWIAPIAGVYDVRLGMQFDTAVNAILCLKKNDIGASSAGDIGSVSTAGVANFTAANISKLVRLNAGDYVAGAVFVSAAAVWNTSLLDSSFFSIRYVEALR